MTCYGCVKVDVTVSQYQGLDCAMALRYYTMLWSSDYFVLTDNILNIALYYYVDSRCSKSMLRSYLCNALQIYNACITLNAVHCFALN